MTLAADGSGWVAREGGTDDPDRTGDITCVGTSADREDTGELLRVLAAVNGLHQKAIDLLDDYAAKKKTRPNKEGSTEGERRVKTNEQSRTPGPRASLFSKEFARAGRATATDQGATRRNGIAG